MLNWFLTEPKLNPCKIKFQSSNSSSQTERGTEVFE